MVKLMELPDRLYKIVFSQIYHPVTAFEDFITRRLLPKSGLILDLGCGTGRYKHDFNSIIGVDVSMKMCKKSKIHQYDVIQADGCHMPFQNETFDGIICHQVIEHISDHLLFLKEIRRILKRNGVLIISTVRNSRYRKNRPLSEDHVREYDVLEFEKILNKLFKVVMIGGYGLEFYICLDTIIPVIPPWIYYYLCSKLKGICRFLIAEAMK